MKHFDNIRPGNNDGIKNYQSDFYAVVVFKFIKKIEYEE